MKKKTIRKIGEIVLVALLVGSIFLMGKLRVHQLHLGRLFPIGFGIVFVILIAYAILFKKTEDPEQLEEPEEPKEIEELKEETEESLQEEE